MINSHSSMVSLLYLLSHPLVCIVCSRKCNVNVCIVRLYTWVFHLKLIKFYLIMHKNTRSKQYRANYPGVEISLQKMIDKWIKKEPRASWELLETALNRIHGPATAIRFQEAVGLPAGIILV